MKLHELKSALRSNPNARIDVIFPDGDHIEPDFHVTEVGHVVKNFIDCGGTKRSTAACVLQTWVAANDKDHRLSAEKLAKILELSREVVAEEDLPLEIEYEGCNIVQYPVDRIEASAGEVILFLGKKHTDCLAKEACGLESGCAPGSGCC